MHNIQDFVKMTVNDLRSKHGDINDPTPLPSSHGIVIATHYKLMSAHR